MLVADSSLFGALRPAVEPLLIAGMGARAELPLSVAQFSRCAPIWLTREILSLLMPLLTAEDSLAQVGECLKRHPGTVGLQEKPPWVGAAGRLEGNPQVAEVPLPRAPSPPEGEDRSEGHPHLAAEPHLGLPLFGERFPECVFAPPAGEVRAKAFALLR